MGFAGRLSRAGAACSSFLELSGEGDRRCRLGESWEADDWRRFVPVRAPGGVCDGSGERRRGDSEVASGSTTAEATTLHVCQSYRSPTRMMHA
jgi:hypothetical protein